MGSCVQAVQLQRQREGLWRDQALQGCVQTQINHAPAQEEPRHQERRLKQHPHQQQQQHQQQFKHLQHQQFKHPHQQQFKHPQHQQFKHPHQKQFKRPQHLQKLVSNRVTGVQMVKTVIYFYHLNTRQKCPSFR